MRHQFRRNIESEKDIAGAERWLRGVVPDYLLGGPCEVVLKRPTRTLDQNAKMWAMLADIASQVVWHGEKLTSEEWKDVLTAGLKKQRAVPGIEGGFVVLGAHTSKMSVQDISDLIDLAYAFGDEQGVTWTEPEQRKAS